MMEQEAIIIHTVGKVGTATLLKTLQQYCPDRSVYWTHCLQKRVLDSIIENETKSQLADQFVDSASRASYGTYLSSRLRQAGVGRELLRRLESGEDTTVMTVVRNPYTHALSSIFHHARWFFPELFDDDRTFNEKCDWFDARLTALFEYVTPGKRSTDDLENTIIGNLTRGLRWWTNEFFVVHGIDILALEGTGPVWEFHLTNRHFFIIQFELLTESIPNVLRRIEPDIHDVKVAWENNSQQRDSDWGSLYQWVKKYYQPSQEIMNYYESQPLSRKFYPAGLFV